jgi:hypothetical protein
MHGCNNEVTSKHAIKGQSSGRLKLCSLFIQRQTRLGFNDSTSLAVKYPKENHREPWFKLGG